MSTHTRRSTEVEHDRRDGSETDVRQVAARVAAWLAAAPEQDPPAEPDALDERPRRWDVLDPAATRIGYPDDPGDDLGERLRALHAERRADLRGDDRRRRRLEVARIAHALCNSLDLTGWERDRVLGVVCELDPADFDGERSVPQVALVVARRVVDAERRAWLGLDDPEWLDERPPERIAGLTERLHLLTEDETYEDFLAEFDLTAAATEQIEETLERDLDDGTLRETALGRSPRCDPALPPFERRTETRTTAPDGAPGNERF